MSLLHMKCTLSFPRWFLYGNINLYDTVDPHMVTFCSDKTDFHAWTSLTLSALRDGSMEDWNTPKPTSFTQPDYIHPGVGLIIDSKNVTSWTQMAYFWPTVWDWSLVKSRTISRSYGHETKSSRVQFSPMVRFNVGQWNQLICFGDLSHIPKVTLPSIEETRGIFVNGILSLAERLFKMLLERIPINNSSTNKSPVQHKQGMWPSPTLLSPHGNRHSLSNGMHNG